MDSLKMKWVVAGKVVSAVRRANGLEAVLLCQMKCRLVQVRVHPKREREISNGPIECRFKIPCCYDHFIKQLIGIANRAQVRMRASVGGNFDA